MKLETKNSEQISEFLSRHVQQAGHACHGVKGQPPAGATYSDGKPIVSAVNVAWQCDCGESIEIVY